MPDHRTHPQKARDGLRLLSQHAGVDLSGESDIAALKKHFGKLAIRLHPDKSGADTATAFAAVSAAWDDVQEAVRCGVRLPLPPDTPPPRPAPAPQHSTTDPRAPRRGPRVYRTVITPGGTFEDIPPPPPPWWQEDTTSTPEPDSQWEAAAGPVRIDLGPSGSLLEEFARRMANSHSGHTVRVTPVPVTRAHATALSATFVLDANQAVDAAIIGQPTYTKLRGTLEQPNSILRGTFRVRFVSRVEAIVDGIRCQLKPPLRA